jgi:hypothetical protein
VRTDSELAILPFFKAFAALSNNGEQSNYTKIHCFREYKKISNSDWSNKIRYDKALSKFIPNSNSCLSMSSKLINLEKAFKYIEESDFCFPKSFRNLFSAKIRTFSIN